MIKRINGKSCHLTLMQLLPFFFFTLKDASVFATLHIELAHKAIQKSEDSEISAKRNSNRWYRYLYGSLGNKFGYAVILIAPEMRLTRCVHVRSVASQHVWPIAFSKLVEIKRFNRPTLQTVVNAFQLFFLGKIHALEFIQQWYVPQMSIFAACKQISSSLHRWVVETSIEPDLVRRFGMSSPLFE